MLVQRGGYYTIADYVHGVVDDSGEEFSALAVRVKAAALYDHAQYVGLQFRADLAPPARAELLARAGAWCVQVVTAASAAPAEEL